MKKPAGNGGLFDCNVLSMNGVKRRASLAVVVEPTQRA